MLTPEENVLWTQISDRLSCPLCKNFLTEPSSLPCGHNFCRLCIEDFMFDKNCCPTCHVYSRPKDVSPSLAISQLMSSFMRFNDFLNTQEKIDDIDDQEVVQSSSHHSLVKGVSPVRQVDISNKSPDKYSPIKLQDNTLGVDTDTTRLESQWGNVVHDHFMVTPHKQAASSNDHIDSEIEAGKTSDGEDEQDEVSDPFASNDGDNDDGVYCIPDTYAPLHEYSAEEEDVIEEDEDWVESYWSQNSQVYESQLSWGRSERQNSPPLAADAAAATEKSIIADTPQVDAEKDELSPVYKKIRLSSDGNDSSNSNEVVDGTSPLRSGVDLSYDSVMNITNGNAQNSSSHSGGGGANVSSGWVSPQVESSSFSHSQMTSSSRKADVGVNHPQGYSEHAVVASTPVSLTQQSEAKCHSVPVLSQLETSRIYDDGEEEEAEPIASESGGRGNNQSSDGGYRSSDGESCSQLSSVERLEKRIQRRKSTIAHLLMQQGLDADKEGEEEVKDDVHDDHDGSTTVAPAAVVRVSVPASTAAVNGIAESSSKSEIIVFVDVDVTSELQSSLDKCTKNGWITLAPVDEFTVIPDEGRPNRKYVLVVASVEKRQGHLLTDRTIQYLKALCLGITIADVTWLQDSVSTDQLKDIISYEIGGSVHDTFFRAPYRARYANRDQEGRSFLLSNYTFTLSSGANAAAACPVSEDDVEWLIHMSNGELLSSPPPAGGRYDSYSSVDKKHVNLVMELRHVSFDSLMYSHEGDIDDSSLSVSWLFDAIANQRIPNQESWEQYRISVFS